MSELPVGFESREPTPSPLEMQPTTSSPVPSCQASSTSSGSVASLDLAKVVDEVKGRVEAKYQELKEELLSHIDTRHQELRDELGLTRCHLNGLAKTANHILEILQNMHPPSRNSLPLPIVTEAELRKFDSMLADFEFKKKVMEHFSQMRASTVSETVYLVMNGVMTSTCAASVKYAAAQGTFCFKRSHLCSLICACIADKFKENNESTTSVRLQVKQWLRKARHRKGPTPAERVQRHPQDGQPVPPPTEFPYTRWLGTSYPPRRNSQCQPTKKPKAAHSANFTPRSTHLTTEQVLVLKESSPTPSSLERDKTPTATGRVVDVAMKIEEFESTSVTDPESLVDCSADYH